MSQLPDILIQIHYHLRPGGVRTVMNRYAETFLHCKNGQAESYIVSSSYGAYTKGMTCKVVDVPECDYQIIIDKTHFFALRDQIISQIEKTFSTISNRTAVIIAHNLTLAKNPALSAAFHLLAVKWSSVKIRFFLVIHDFAEEGRTDLMEQITSLEAQGVSIRESLYCIGAPVHIVSPGVEWYNLLKKTGFPVTLLQNPIISLPESENGIINNRQEYKNRLKKYAEIRGIELDISKKIFYYPVRVITRKNILESIVISCFLCNGILLTGQFGKSKIDRQRFDFFNTMIKKYKLPVIFDSPDIFSDDDYTISPVARLMSICDIAISSSIAEGFGYGLFDPWLYDRAVIARKPSGFILPENWDESIFYSWFPAPQEWVSLDLLSNRYRDQYYNCFKSNLPWKVDKVICRNSTVDFGALDEISQYRIIELVLNDKQKMKMWMALLEKKSSIWPGIENLTRAAQNNICRQKELILDQFSYKRFQSQFESCFSQKVSIIAQTINPIYIQNIFQSSKFFKLLLNPQSIM